MHNVARLISIVDDDLSVCRALGRLVKAAGYSVETFASAHEFLDSSPSDRTACLVLDIHLNGMSGFDLEERLMAERVAIPIIFITAHDDAATRERISDPGRPGIWRNPSTDRRCSTSSGRSSDRRDARRRPPTSGRQRLLLAHVGDRACPTPTGRRLLTFKTGR
jgi:DNA-binding NtrC family response regulator